MTEFRHGEGFEYRPPTIEEFDFTIDIRQGFIDTDEETTPVTIDDILFDHVVSAYSDPYYDLSIIGNIDDDFEVLDATGSMTGNRVSRISNGMCRVLAKHYFRDKLANLDMTRINDNEYNSFVEYVSGSLARNVVEGARTRAVGTTSANKPIYSTQNHADGTYVRNPNCWAADIDLTCVSPWNSRGVNTRAGTAISPLHILCANHYRLQAGDTIRFIAEDNTVVTRTIDSVVNDVGFDIQVLKLNSALPGTITPAKFLAADAFDDYLPSIVNYSIPFLGLDAQENALVMDSYLHIWNNSITRLILVQRSVEWEHLSELIVGGDSGNPCFVVINGEAVLISHWSADPQGIYAIGPGYHTELTNIAAAMTTLGGGYSPQIISLSSFTDYGA